MKITIIIPTYNKWSLTVSRLMELSHYCSNVYEVVLVDDASTEPFTQLDFWKDRSPWKLVYERIMTNKGFGFSMNLGAALATGDVFVFLSNDVVIKKDFIPEIERQLEINKHPILMGTELLKHNTGWNMIGDVVVPYLHGWFLACSRDVWNVLGGFDHKTYGLSDYEDIDLSLTAIENNIMLVVLQDQDLKHKTAQTFGYTPERLARTKSNQVHFIQKWQSKIGGLSAKIRSITGG